MKKILLLLCYLSINFIYSQNFSIKDSLEIRNLILEDVKSINKHYKNGILQDSSRANFKIVNTSIKERGGVYNFYKVDVKFNQGTFRHDYLFNETISYYLVKNTLEYFDDTIYRLDGFFFSDILIWCSRDVSSLSGIDFIETDFYFTGFWTKKEAKEIKRIVHEKKLYSKKESVFQSNIVRELILYKKFKYYANSYILPSYPTFTGAILSYKRK